MYLDFETDTVCVTDYGAEYRIAVVVTSSPTTDKVHVAAFLPGALAPGFGLPAVGCWADDWITAGADLIRQVICYLRHFLERHPEGGTLLPVGRTGRA